MNFARKDYNQRIVDIEGKIPEDEPVFLLRGQDQLAPKLLLMWAMELRLHNGDPAMAESAERHAQAMIKWQKDHGVKTPDMYNDEVRRYSRNSINNLLAKISETPTCYPQVANKLMEMLKSYFGADNPPFALIMNMDLLEDAKAKDPHEVVYEDIDFNSVQFKEYKLILYFSHGGAYIIRNQI